MSRAWGEINSIDLPIWCRKPCFYLYSWVFNCNLNEIDIEDLNELHYTSCVIKEALRKWPIAVDLNRICPFDYEIGSFKIPEGSKIQVIKYLHI